MGRGGSEEEWGWSVFVLLGLMTDLMFGLLSSVAVVILKVQK